MKDRSTWIMGAIFAALILIEFLFIHPHHPAFPWHHVPGFQGLLGLGTCVLAVIFCKMFLTHLIQRPEEPDNEV